VEQELRDKEADADPVSTARARRSSTQGTCHCPVGLASPHPSSLPPRNPLSSVLLWVHGLLAVGQEQDAASHVLGLLISNRRWLLWGCAPAPPMVEHLLPLCPSLCADD
jgi:hypothetical protein